MLKPLRICITTGDLDGIGMEVTAKALAKVKPMRGVHLYLWRSSRSEEKYLRLIDSQFKRKTVSTWYEALNTPHDSYKWIIDICSQHPPAKWVEESALAGSFGHIDGITTAPLSKKAIISAGMNDIGHTEILKKITKAKDLYMGFLGSKFNVLIMTGHLPIDEVPEALTARSIEKSIIAANQMRQILPKKFTDKPLALVGLNPHAGEDGLIGQQEKKLFSKALKSIQDKKIKISEPLVPDVAFFQENWKKYSLYVCPYHDQALIPFKMIHHEEPSVHVTMGLKFIRTSVDHGTAKDIFGKNKANPSSMVEAIKLCAKLCRVSQKEGNILTNIK